MPEPSAFRKPPKAPFGLREDGTPKGKGFFGLLKRPDGGVSTELSITIGLDGKEVLMPLLVPTLTKKEIDLLLVTTGIKDVPKEIIDKAVSHAKKRMNGGESPFFD